jgi:hypothetical protein
VRTVLREVAGVWIESDMWIEVDEEKGVIDKE